MKDCYICEENIIHEENIESVRNKMIEEDSIRKFSNIFKVIGILLRKNPRCM
jgi:hypothetical protein